MEYGYRPIGRLLAASASSGSGSEAVNLAFAGVISFFLLAVIRRRERVT